MALPPQRKVGEKLYYKNDKNELKFGYVVKVGFYITSSEGLTFCFYEMHDDWIIRSCDILEPEEAKLLAFTKGVTLDFID